MCRSRSSGHMASASVRPWRSLEDVIAAVREAQSTSRNALLRRHNRGCEARQVLPHVAATHCRGWYSLAELVQALGPVSLAAVSNARSKVSQRMACDPHLKKRVGAITHGPALRPTRQVAVGRRKDDAAPEHPARVLPVPVIARYEGVLPPAVGENAVVGDAERHAQLRLSNRRVLCLSLLSLSKSSLRFHESYAVPEEKGQNCLVGAVRSPGPGGEAADCRACR